KGLCSGSGHFYPIMKEVCERWKTPFEAECIMWEEASAASEKINRIAEDFRRYKECDLMTTRAVIKAHLKKY
ncbi:MAG: hypothetical protein ACOCW1_03365, partial [Chitinispirillaceae bacterium]